MSNSTGSYQAQIPIDPEAGLMLNLTEILIPLFQNGPIDATLARQMAGSAIESYRPQTRADLVNVARTIAFSMTAIALLGAAASQDMTMAEQMRAFGRANALNRSADQSERTMMQRRRHQQANPPVDPPAERPQPAEPDRPVDDAGVQAEVAKIMQEYLAIPPATPIARALDVKRTASASPQPAVNGGLAYDAVTRRTTPLKQALMQNTAMQHEIGRSGAQSFR